MGLLFALFAANVAAFTTGRVTDAVTGKPIEGATVYAIWYYHPWRIPLPVETQGHRDLMCGGSAVVRTDADGEYDLGLWMNVDILIRKSAVWVSAPGYYDSHQKHPSRRLDPYAEILSTLSMECARYGTRLVARADATGRRVDGREAARDRGEWECGRLYVGHRSAPLREWLLQRNRCKPSRHVGEAGPDQPPRTGVFKALFPSPIREVPTWSSLVLPLLGSEASNPVSALALRNACALLQPKPDRAAVLRITIEDAESGAPASHMPVRILWGASERAGTPHRGVSEVAARRGFVATTDDAGVVDLPVTPEMLGEAPPQKPSHQASFHYAVIPYASDRIAFASQPQKVPIVCDASGILYFGVPADLRGNITTSGDPRCTGHARGMTELNRGPAIAGSSVGRSVARGGALSAVGATRSSVNAAGPSVTPLIDSPIAPEYRDVPEIIRKENARRLADPATAANRAMVYVYPWSWPPAALLARAYQLIDIQPEIESDADGLLVLERREVREAFDALCASPADAELKSAFQITRELWWVETQTEGLDRANSAAQERLATWDNGARCKYRDGRMIALGSTDPPNPLTAGKVCSAWNADRAVFEEDPTAKPPSLDAFAVDYTQREGACTHLERDGSTL